MKAIGRTFLIGYALAQTAAAQTGVAYKQFNNYSLLPAYSTVQEVQHITPRVQAIQCLDNGFESGVGYWNHQWLPSNPCFVLSPGTPSPGSSMPGWVYNASCTYINPPFPPSTLQSQNTFIVENVARPGGGVKSMRIGSGMFQGNGGTGIEISKSFSLPLSGNNAYLSYWYKVDIPQGYDVGQAFEVTVSGSGCSGGFSHTDYLSPTASSPASGPWINKVVSLCNLDGCSITVAFRVKGCSNNGHSVLVYVDDICLVAETNPVITPVSPRCTNDAPVTLTASPAGGTFSGPGVSGNIFDPAVAGAGTHTITYSYTSPSGCSAPLSQTTTITVNPTPAVNFVPLSTYCVNTPPVDLNDAAVASPAGGIFSGPGVSGTVFTPSIAGPGTHSINYTYTDPVTNCSASSSAIIVVNALPLVSFTPPSSLCVNDPATDLNTAGIVNPTGGIFSGVGITGSLFDPLLAGTGTHIVTYSYTSPVTGCAASVTAVMAVHPTVNETESISLCPGQTYTLPSGVVVTAPGTYTSNVLTAYGCERIVTTTVTTCCHCEGSNWGNVSYVTPTLQTVVLQLTCNASLKPAIYDLECKVPVTLNAIYNCSSASCSSAEVVITPPSGPVTTHPLPYVFTPMLTGVYSIAYRGYCGATLCKTCYLRFRVKCPPVPTTPGQQRFQLALSAGASTLLTTSAKDSSAFAAASFLFDIRPAVLVGKQWGVQASVSYMKVTPSEEKLNEFLASRKYDRGQGSLVTRTSGSNLMIMAGPFFRTTANKWMFAIHAMAGINSNKVPGATLTRGTQVLFSNQTDKSLSPAYNGGIAITRFFSRRWGAGVFGDYAVSKSFVRNFASHRAAGSRDLVFSQVQKRIVTGVQVTYTFFSRN